ncbi:molybdate ABC transporter substrate-binding protein [Prosthecochloris sp. ZM_2]|uniref:molybdate ABC transporter substrate-binding protein n=1 Tax=Prosthecochloris sp. ZM_2 TaxID=2045206 RepID=UPI000DF85E55|nr:molybdate ABC transporter substrate-binding protein [Prosthecochloris sp. ZM_2]RNA64563.1 molybdate ABC transporter substrate-binding protein [Prosthecochloris sp. ZM_2]
MINHLFTALCSLVLLCQAPLFAGDITIASGAGYKRPLQDITTLYREKTGNTVSAVFGNMHQIISQASLSGSIAIMIGDQKFFDRSGLDFASFQPVGKGRLVLAWRKGLNLERIGQITAEDIERIGFPDSSKAIYGSAATQYLANSGLMENTAEKLLKLSTVPQVSSYIISKEIDAGFINLTDAIGIAEAIGGYLPADESLYSSIAINAGVLKEFSNNPDVRDFLDFLDTAEARTILKTYGL